METKENQPVLKYDNLLVSARGITETHGNKVVIFVPAADVDRVALKFGRAEHNLVFSLSIGVVLALVGVFGLIEFIRVPRLYRYELGMAVFGALGGSLIYDALKARFYLEVTRKKGMSRLVFSKKASRSEINNFCLSVRANYAYQIADEI